MARAYDADYWRGTVYEGGYDRRPLPGYGRDYGAHDPDAGAYSWRRRRGRRGRLVPRTDWRAGAGSWPAGGTWPGEARVPASAPEAMESLLHGRRRPGYAGGFSGFERRERYPGDTHERQERYPGGARRWRDVPPDWRRYLSREEYGLGPDGSHDREFEGNRFRRGRLGARNALFGGEGFVRYDRDYDEQWW